MKIQRKDPEQWHPHFALLPKTVSDGNGAFVTVWLDWVERRIQFEGYGWGTRYRLMQSEAQAVLARNLTGDLPDAMPTLILC